jgi:hypothetical protein
MNSRGPLPQPDSRRGINGTNNAPTDFLQESVTSPSWLPKRHHAEFQKLIDMQHGAGVGTRQADADLYAQYVILLDDFRRAKDPDQRQKARRVMAGLEDSLVIGEKSRQRVGIRGKKAPAKGKLALMIAEKNGTDG